MVKSSQEYPDLLSASASDGKENSDSITAKKIWSVSELNHEVQQKLQDHYPDVRVSGEISDFIQARSGHWYFTLRDEDGKAEIKCVIFKSYNRQLSAPQLGAQVECQGQLNLYVARGSFQLNAWSMAAAGEGLRQKAFEQLKAALEKEGLLSSERKRPLPALCRRLALITSEDGAAMHDVLKTIKRRFPVLRVSLLPVLVQGPRAPEEIAQALEYANRCAAQQQPPIDAVLITRGGGSQEDLEAFNSERLARAIAASKLPVVSAVGHEVDFTIADLVADQRAATPTAGGELLTPDGAEWLRRLKQLQALMQRRLAALLEAPQAQLPRLNKTLKRTLEQLCQRHAQSVDELERRLEGGIRRHVQQKQNRVTEARLKLERQNPKTQFIVISNKHQELTRRLQAAMGRVLADKKQILDRREEMLRGISPLASLKRGYSITYDDSGRVVVDAEQLRVGDAIQTRLAGGQLVSTVSETSGEHRSKNRRA